MDEDRWSLTHPPFDLPLWPRCPRCNALCLPLGMDRMRCSKCRWYQRGPDIGVNDPLDDGDETLL